MGYKESLSTVIYKFEINNSLVMKGIDESTGITLPFYDIDLNIVYFVGKGESIIKYCEVTNTFPFLEFLGSYKGAQPQKGASFLPKRAVDPMKCEVIRGVRLTLDQVEYVSFVVPRKSEAFQEDLYPSIPSIDPAMTHEEWVKGKDEEPIRVPMKPNGNLS